jgi:hypothetical protein
LQGTVGQGSGAYVLAPSGTAVTVKPGAALPTEPGVVVIGQAAGRAEVHEGRDEG